MEEIKSYKLSDGRIIEDKNEAEKLEKELTFKSKLIEFVDREGSYTEICDAIYDVINDNREELRTMLNALYG